MRTKRQVARRRGLVALVLVLAGLILGLGWWQARARRAGAPAAFERALQELLAPSVRAAGELRNGLLPDPADTPPLTPVGLAELRALQEENRRLRALLALRDRLPSAGLVAEVIGRNPDGYLIINKGTREGVAPRMVAVTPEGVVGQVRSAVSRTAVLLPLTDTVSGVGAAVARINAPGILQGGRDGRCILRQLPDGADARVDDQVVTSGLGSVYPPGLPLGRITAFEHDQALSARLAIVQPAVDLARVEFVVLVKRAP